MNTILNQFQDKINGTFSFFGRMIIKGHIRQFFSTSGSGYFLSSLNVLLKDFSSFANQVTNTLVSQVEEFTSSQNRPLIYLTSAKDSKEQKALEIMENDSIREGLLCTLSVVEYCQKLQTWFPFQIQVYINGREMMKHIFEENGITYQMYDNSFFEISDIEKAQELADNFDSKKLCHQLDFFAHKVNPYLDTIESIFHQGYHWCVDQCEYATDVIFKSREALEDIYPSPVGYTFYDFGNP